jgi:hypothetical protein
MKSNQEDKIDAMPNQVPDNVPAPTTEPRRVMRRIHCWDGKFMEWWSDGCVAKIQPPIGTGFVVPPEMAIWGTIPSDVEAVLIQAVQEEGVDYSDMPRLVTAAERKESKEDIAPNVPNAPVETRDMSQSYDQWCDGEDELVANARPDDQTDEERKLDLSVRRDEQLQLDLEPELISSERDHDDNVVQLYGRHGVPSMSITMTNNKDV